jgi:serine/threonine protein kinase
MGGCLGKSSAVASDGRVTPGRTGTAADLEGRILKDTVFTSKYEMGTKLGEGSYASVYAAQSLDDGSEWAVKIIDKSKCSPDELEEVRWEAEALQIVRHENITFLKEVLESANYYYLVMEVMSGGELFDRIIAKEHYSEKMARDAIKTIVIALLQCHDQNVVHLDIKPENVLYQGPEDSDPLKICDFGISRKCADGSLIASDGHFHGTPGYIPPEMVKREPYGRGCDVWAVGCLAYILLAGYPPFDGDEETPEGQEELFGQIMTGAFFPFAGDGDEEVNVWDEVSESAKDFIRKCFTVDQSQRPSFDQLLVDGWLAADVADKHLSASKTKLQNFNAKRRLKGAIRKVISANRMKDMLSKLRGAADDLNK